jgi:hypothetical protein
LQGAQGLYRGMSAPLLAQGVYKAVLFSSYDFAQDCLSSTRRGEGVHRLTLPQLFLCGAFAGTPIRILPNLLTLGTLLALLTLFTLLILLTLLFLLTLIPQLASRKKSILYILKVV